MKFSIIAPLTLSFFMFSSMNAVAEQSLNNDSCNVNLHANIVMNPQKITFSNDSSILYSITNNKILAVDGDAVALDEQQQQLVTEYSNKIRHTIPKVKVLALDAVDLAVDSINIAFTDLLGNNSQVSKNITAEFDVIRQEIEQQLDNNSEITLGDKNSVINEQFEEKMENAIESTIQKSIGSLMIAFGKAMMSSEDDSDAFADKMDDFSDKFEKNIEEKTTLIEQKVQPLCADAIAIDRLEEQLKQMITNMPSFNVLTATEKSDQNNKI